MQIDTQTRVSNSSLAKVKKLCRIFTKRDGYKWTIKNMITYLINTHPEIAPKTDDEKV